MTKICSKCLKEKSFKKFNKHKQGKFGLRACCKSCQSKAYKKYSKKNKEKESLRKTNWKKSEKYKIWKQNYELTLDARFVTMKSRSKTAHGQESNLSKSEYKKLVLRGCYYCGVNLENVGGVSLDRIDTTKGYIKSNVIPCCARCNAHRSNRYSVKEFKIIKRFD